MSETYAIKATDADPAVFFYGIPVGFGVPLYASDEVLSIFRRYPGWAFRHPCQRTPAHLFTKTELLTVGKRPRNALSPDGFRFSPPHWPYGPYDDSLPVIPIDPLFEYDEARDANSENTVEDVIRDRRAAADWAAATLADPDTVLMCVSMTGSTPSETDDPHAYLASLEFTITDATGSLIWQQPVNPQWDPISHMRPWVAKYGLKLKTIKEAPIFKDVKTVLLSHLDGKRVILYGRSFAMASLFGDFEWEALNGRFGPGEFWGEHKDIVAALSRSKWECAQLQEASYRGRWDAEAGRYALPEAPGAGTNGLARCQAVAALLEAMAGPTRYQELNQVALDATAAGRSHVPRERTVTRQSRIAAARRAVLIRSCGACENPACPDPRFTDVLTMAGKPILQVDHIDDHAKGGADVPMAMIALCPNCHAIKTYGSEREAMRESLRQAALKQHEKMLAELPPAE
ncbi:HNH endonuclease signature motif containing protein [Streptomyces sp. MJP52]|uniref:HNH endonuclease signature motif containing protein n=1 Tax=Streptomyces sp. MJP52 TaxID=2940555 RepID=UPI002475D7F3|nr:HNH endonuclease signature motif containing protein [Streptomyces sp. MJP52]MDH6223682.1 5-methylcytosine-specific restriction protein A [Streptomyces sp. MJP52]